MAEKETGKVTGAAGSLEKLGISSGDLGVEAFKAALEYLNKINEPTSLPADFIKGITDSAKVMADGNAALAAYADSITRIATQETSIAVSLANQLENLRAMAAEREISIKAREAAAATQRQIDEGTGHITHGERITQDAAAKVKSVQDESTRKHSDAATQWGYEEAAIKRMQSNQIELDSDAKSKREKATQDAARIARIKRDLGTDDSRAITDREISLNEEAEQKRQIAEGNRKGPNFEGEPQAVLDSEEQLPSTPGGQEDAQAESIAQAIRVTGQATGDQLKIIGKAFSDATGRQAQSLSEILNLFNGYLDNMDTLLGRIQAIEKRLSSQVQQAHYNSQ